MGNHIWVIQNKDGLYYKGKRNIPWELRQKYGELCDWTSSLNSAALYWNHDFAVDSLVEIFLNQKARIIEYELMYRRSLSYENARMEIEDRKKMNWRIFENLSDEELIKSAKRW